MLTSFLLALQHVTLWNRWRKNFLKYSPSKSPLSFNQSCFTCWRLFCLPYSTWRCGTDGERTFLNILHLKALYHLINLASLVDVFSPCPTARDVVEQMAKDGIDNINDFQWIAQLRYYYEEGVVAVRMITTTIMYGYEYLGNSGRLVITPLTDRCYRCVLWIEFIDIKEKKITRLIENVPKK